MPYCQLPTQFRRSTLLPQKILYVRWVETAAKVEVDMSDVILTGQLAIYWLAVLGIDAEDFVLHSWHSKHVLNMILQYAHGCRMMQILSDLGA